MDDRDTVPVPVAGPGHSSLEYYVRQPEEKERVKVVCAEVSSKKKFREMSKEV